MLQNLSSAAVVIGGLRVKIYLLLSQILVGKKIVLKLFSLDIKIVIFTPMTSADGTFASHVFSAYIRLDISCESSTSRHFTGN